MTNRFYRFDSLLVFFMILGILAYWIGTGLNALVLNFNNDEMPSAAPTMSIVPSESGFAHGYATSETRFATLGDILFIDFSNIEGELPSGAVKEVIMWWSRVLNYPLEGGTYFISLGDTLRWGGSALFLLVLPFLLIRLLCRAGGTYTKIPRFK